MLAEAERLAAKTGLDVVVLLVEVLVRSSWSVVDLDGTDLLGF